MLPVFFFQSTLGLIAHLLDMCIMKKKTIMIVRFKLNNVHPVSSPVAPGDCQ